MLLNLGRRVLFVCLLVRVELCDVVCRAHVNIRTYIRHSERNV